jgi:hypothetical protein
MSFFLIKMGNRKAKQDLSGGLIPVGGEKMQGKGAGGEYGRNIIYSCMKMEK